MPKADGSILIDTKIDTKDVSSQMLRLENRLSKFAKKASVLTDEMRKMESSKMPTDEFAEVQKFIDDTTKKMDGLNERMEKFIAIGGKTDSRAFKSMQYDLDQLTKSLEYARGEAQDYLDSGTAYKSVDDIKTSPEYQKKAEQLSEINAQMDITSQKIEELSAKEEAAASSTDRLATKGEATASSAENIAKEEARAGNEAQKSEKKTRGWLDSFKSRAKSTGEKVSGLASRLKSAGSAFKNFITHGKKGSSMLSTFGTRLNGIALSMFVFNWITKAWNAMISSVKDGVQNMARYSGDVNAKMSALVSAVATLKNAFGALAAPIISAVGPALTYLINMLTAAINKVNQFISALTGKKTWTKATTQTKNYAAGLDAAASKADKATKAAKKLQGQLQSFDDLNVITTNKDSDSGSGGGSGGSGGGVSDLYEEVPINKNIADLADEIKKAIKSGDWEGLGETIRSEITNTIGKIPWEKIYKKADKFGTGFASFLNGLFSEDKKGNSVFTATADVIVGALNTVIFASKGFTDKFEFDTLGKNVAHGFNRFFKKFKWKQCAEAINGWVDGFWSLAAGFFGDLSWSDILNGLKTFLTSLSSKTIATLLGAYALKKFGKSAVGALADSVGGQTFNVKIKKVFFTIAAITIAAEGGLTIGEAIGKKIAELTQPEEMRKYQTTFNFSDLFSYSPKEWGQGFKDWWNDTWGPAFKLMALDMATGNYKLKIPFTSIELPSFNEINKKITKWSSGVKKCLKKAKKSVDLSLGEIFGGKKKVQGFDGKKTLITPVSELGKGKVKDNAYSGSKAKKDQKIIDEAWEKRWGKGYDSSAKVKVKAEITSAEDKISKNKKKLNNYTASISKNKDNIKTGDKFLKNYTANLYKNKDGILSKDKSLKNYIANLSDNKDKIPLGYKLLNNYTAKLVGNKDKIKSSDKKLDNYTGKLTKAQDNIRATDKKIGGFTAKITSFANEIKNKFLDFTARLTGGSTKKANGGIYTGGMWHNITQYAVGTENAPAGQLFVAREAGPELVGTIGGHTAVVNNDQIVASVSDGVYRAVRSAMGTGGQNVNVTFRVEGDPQRIFKITREQAREFTARTGRLAYEF